MRALAFALTAAASISCGLPAFGVKATLAPPISAAFLTVQLVAKAGNDAQERARLPGLRDAIAGALPGAWATATGGRGRLALQTDADIEVDLDGTAGTSALTQHKLAGRIVTRTIAVHTIADGRHLSLPELMVTTLHELGHIWCCYGPGTTDGHWQSSPAAFSPVGVMGSPLRCQVSAGADPVCPSVFSERELSELGLTRAP